MAVGEHQRGAVVGLRLAERRQCLLRIGAHRDPGDVDAAVGDRLQGEVLLGHGLAGGGELGDRAERRRLRHLAAGVGVDLGVEHEHVDVAPAGQDVVEPAGADVVGPAVAADDPDAAPDEVVDDAAQVGRRRRRPARRAAAGARPPARAGHRSSDSRSCGAARISSTSSAPTCVAQLGEAPAGQLGVAVGGEPEAEPELGVVLEERVRPGRAAPVGVGRPGRGRQVAAVDRRAAGCVRDHQPVAEQLREELQVRRLAAARAGAGELEQRLQELGAAHCAEVDPRPVARGQRLEERDVVALGGDQRLARGEVDRLASRVARRDGRARLDAQPAAGAVLDVDLQRVPGVGQADGFERSRPEPVRCALQAGLVVVRRADHAVRADEAAVAALDAQVGVPDRDQLRDVALLVGRRAARVRAVHRQRADRQIVAPAGQHLGRDRANELGRMRGHHRRQPAGRRHPLGHARRGAVRRARGRPPPGCARPPRRRVGRRSSRPPS